MKNVPYIVDCHLQTLVVCVLFFFTKSGLLVIKAKPNFVRLKTSLHPFLLTPTPNTQFLWQLCRSKLRGNQPRREGPTVRADCSLSFLAPTFYASTT